MTHGRRAWLRGAVYLVTLALLLAFARHVEWHGAWRAARSADWRLLVLAAIVNLASLALKGVRWWVFLRPFGVRSLALVVRATFAGASLNNLLVAQAGEGARVALVSRASGVTSAHVLAALAMERTLDAVSYLLLFVGVAWLIDLPEPTARWRLAATAALVALVAAGVVLVRRAAAPTAPGSRPGTHHRTGDTPPPDWTARVRGYLARVVRAAGETASPARLTAGMLLSVGAWTMQVATYHLVARAAHLPLSLTGTIAALLTVGISFLVRATPGNVGVFQLVYALTVRAFGIAEEPAIAVALLIQVIQVMPTMVVGTMLTPHLVERRHEAAT